MISLLTLFIFAKNHVQRPMQIVFHSPMTSNTFVEVVAGVQTADKKSLLRLCFVFQFTDINYAQKQNNDNSLNLQYFLNNGLELIYNPLKMWETLDLGDKKRFQSLLFPEGLIFDKENKVIEPSVTNLMFVLNPLFIGDFEVKEKGFCSKKTAKSKTVPRAGLEPAQSQ